MKRSCFYYTITSSLFVLLNCVSLQGLFAQTLFRDVTHQPVLSYGSAGEWDDGAVWFPSVIKDGDTLRMWYTGLDNTVWQEPLYQIGYAWSLDGIIWNKFIGNPVLTPELLWEGRDVSFCTVIKDVDTLKMWYGAGDIPGAPPTIIGYATSFDGITWSKHPEPVIQLGLTLDWDDGVIAPHSVINEGGEYKMWFWAGRPGFPMDESMPQTGLATSTDGIHWTKYDDPITTEAPFAESDPVLKVGSTSDWDSHRIINPIVLSTESGYEMWYSGLKGPISTSTKLEIGYATSADGIQWTKSPENPVIPDYSFSWGKSIYGGSILKYDGDYHFWFACFHTPPTQARPQIGYAESYEPALKQMASLDVARGGSESCVNDSMIYVFGGCNSAIDILSTAQVYNVRTNEWSDLAPMPIGLYEPNVEIINDTIYIVGGWYKNANGNWLTSDSTFAYDPDGDNWTVRANCPEATGTNSSCVLNDTIYILGGTEFPGSTDVKKAWYYVPEKDIWGDEIQDMIYQHGEYGSACVLDSTIYAIGGVNATTEIMFPVQAEKYSGGIWEKIADMPIPVANHVTITYDNRILTFGGDSGTFTPSKSYATNLIQEYNPTTNSWRQMQGIPFVRSNMTGEKVGNYVYLIGGYNHSRDFRSPLSEVWRFNLDSLIAFISVSGISLDKHSLELHGSETATLVATITPTDASDPSVSWTSGDAAVATVANGTVTGVAIGQTYIYATTTDVNFMDSCQITITPGVGIFNNKAGHISIFPNPTNNLLTIQTDSHGTLFIEINSLNGQLVHTTKMEGTSHQIDLSSFQKGVYLITVRSEDFVTTRKIIKL